MSSENVAGICTARDTSQKVKHSSRRWDEEKAPAVADEVNDNVRTPGLAPVSRNLACGHDRLGIVGIDVQHGGANRLGHVCRMHRGAALSWGSREPHLVIHHQMQHAAHRKACRVPHTLAAASRYGPIVRLTS